MDKTNESKQPPGLSPQVRPTIPTSRREPPLLEELAAGPARKKPPTRPPEPSQQAPADGGAQPDEQFDWLAPLHNRLIIAGASILVLLALTAIVLLVFSSGDGDPGIGPRVGVAGSDATTPTPDETLTALTLNTTTLHSGPGVNFPPVGTVRRGTRVPIIGRNADDTWLQVMFPPGAVSPIEGWIDVVFLDVTGDLKDVDIAGPGNGPSIIVPTRVPTLITEEPTNTSVPTDTPAAKPTDEPSATPEVTSEPLETETPPSVETPAPTATQAPPPTETPADAPDTAAPTKSKPQASSDRLTAPATLMRRPQLSMLPSGVARQVTRRYRERAV